MFDHTDEFIYIDPLRTHETDTSELLIHLYITWQIKLDENQLDERNIQ